MSNACVVLTTTASEEEALAISQGLVENHLAACVQRFQMTSVYEWNGTIENLPEMLLLIKTTADRYEAVEAWLGAHHSYTIPEVLMLPVRRGSPGYLEWVAHAVSPTEGGPVVPPGG